MLTFRRGYFLLATLLFGAEAGIAAFAHDALLRLYGGDLLATIVLYPAAQLLLLIGIKSVCIAIQGKAPLHTIRLSARL